MEGERQIILKIILMKWKDNPMKATTDRNRGDWPPKVEELLDLLGKNGDRENGYALLFMIAFKLFIVREKQPVFAEGIYHGLGEITHIVDEFEHVVEKGTPPEQRDKCLSLIASAIRFLNEEYKKA